MRERKFMTKQKMYDEVQPVVDQDTLRFAKAMFDKIFKVLQVDKARHLWYDLRVVRWHFNN